MSADVGSVHNLNRPMRTSQMFLAIDVARFLPADEFVGRMKRLAQAAKSSAPAAGFDEVLIAGEPEWREEARRKQNGIPITAGAWELLVNVARKLGVALPSPSS
jgi:LDH2 family malate/lactate/ureidoglycolate dehydrogenase